jgi:pyruvate formate-lyase/glycerol dehydratase family glycyl radical enzyme
MDIVAGEKVGVAGNGRVNKLRESVLCIPELCIERAYLLTESYKETEGEPPLMRRAKALEKILREMTVHIEDGELIVGRATSKRRGSPLIPEVSWEWCLEQINTVSEKRDWDEFAPLTEEDKAKMREFLPYWKGRSLYDKGLAMIPKDVLEQNLDVQAPGPPSCLGNTHIGHYSVDYERVITKGLNDVKKQVDEELARLDITEMEDFQKSQFLNAVNITLEAAIGFTRRYAELARIMAEKETDTRRKAELEQIAETCAWVPANPARSFYEALQSVWFVYIILMIEGWGAGTSFGRADQYLLSFYRKDIEEGRITREEARELIGLLYIKMNELVMRFSYELIRTGAGLNVLSNTTLGGLTKEGNDAVNELSYLFLDAEEDVRLLSDDIVIRVHKNTPDAFLMRACEIARLLRGKLKFVSDETAIQQLLSDGKPPECARDYIVVGCLTPTVPAYSQDAVGGLFNLPLMLELALNNGVSRLSGKQIGPNTGDPRKFKSYDEVWSAYKKQVENALRAIVIFRNIDKQLYADYTPTPFQSALFHGCIEKGLDITSGGTAPYITHGISASAIPNVGDSLAAIKKAVFEDKKITMDRLIDALDKNFEGEEEILHILKSVPKFGNDDDYVDSMVNEALTHFSSEAARYKGLAGAKLNAAAMITTGNVQLGYLVGALPDGRRAGEPLSEGGISPYQGRNVNGPTATMRSVAKLDLVKLSGGSVLNMRFNPDVLKDNSKMRNFASLIRTFCEAGGYLVQFNIVSTDMLREAQTNPKKYKDLLVRVATYSAYFVQIGSELQNDIINRMEFQDV